MVVFLIYSIFLIGFSHGCFPSFQQPFGAFPQASYPAYSYGSYAPPPGHYSAPSIGSYGGSPYSSSKSRMASDRGTFVASGDSIDTQTTDTSSGCTLDRYEDQKLNCATPFDRRVPISTEAECQQICLENLLSLCKSFQYNLLKKNCDLYDVSLSENTPLNTPFMASGAQLLSTDLVPLGGLGQNANNLLAPFLGLKTSADQPIEKESENEEEYKQKRRRRYLSQNGVPSFAELKSPEIKSPEILNEGLFSKMGRLPTEKCQPEIVPGKDIIFVALSPQCQGIKVPGISPLFPSTSAPNYSNKLGVEMLGTPYGSSSYGPPSRKPLENADSLNTIKSDLSGDRNVLPLSDCPDGASVKIEMIEGVALVEQRPIARIQLNSADMCLNLCKNNANLDGTQFTRACRSATFDRVSSRCEILDDAISPNGELNYIPNADSLYFEKICLPEMEIPLGCDDVIHRIPQHTLDSRASGTGAVVTALTQADCIMRCIMAQKKLGFECTSASFYFDWTTSNCYLSRFTRLNRPDIYVSERRQLVDYLELAPCMRQSWQHDDATTPGPTWSSWSDCDHTSTKIRRRNCTYCSTNIETLPCGQTTSKIPSIFDNEMSHHVMQQQQQPTKRLKQSEENGLGNSLFGEQDYANQAEVSYFGPPHRENSSPFSTNNNTPPKTSIKAVKSVDFEENVFPQNKLNNGQKCDPYLECCAKPNELKNLVRGCSIGYRIQRSEGSSGHEKIVQCLPKDCL